MNGLDIMRKAADIGFANLHVTEAQFNCCGAIIKYRTGRESKENLGAHEMGCPYCEGQQEFDPHSWDTDYGPDLEYAHQPDGYPDLNMAQIQDQMQEMKETEAGEGFDGETYECDHCGGTSTLGELAEHDPSEYDERLNDRMGNHRVTCPMCEYGEYDDLESHASQTNDRNAADWGRESGAFDYDEDSRILAERISMGQGSVDNPMQGRPTRSQLKARRALQQRGGNMGYGKTLGDMPFGEELETAIDRYNRNYGPDSLKDPRQPPWNADAKEGPTMPEIRRPMYDRDKDKLLQGGY